MRNIQTNKWQRGKVGNIGDLNSYVHEDSNKKDVRTCTNTTLCAEGKSRKVTQPPNVTQSYGTLSRKCNERRGNKQSEHERNNAQTQTQREKTLPPNRMVSDGMVATKQISHNRDSNENAAERFALDFYRENRHDDVVGEEYRLFASSAPINSARMERLHVTAYANGADFTTPSATATTISTELHNRDLSRNYQMPSTSSVSHVQPQQQQQQHVPVSLTNNISDSSARASYSGAANPLSDTFSVPCTSSVLICRNDFDYQLKKNVLSIDVGSMTHDDKHHNDIKCKVDVNNMENDRNRVNVVECNQHVIVLMSNEIDHEVRDESANSNVKSFQSAEKSSSEATSGPLTNHDNLIITSAIENLSMASAANGTPSKAKYSNDIVTLREKRRRDRRDRRLARTRATNCASLSSTTNEILPDIINNHSPPPYADIPPQQIVPSVVSTVPVEDNRYTFSLPLVRR